MNDLANLQLRKKICLKLIEMLQTDEELLADPRQPSALLEYQRQLSSIQSKIDGILDTQTLLGNKPPKTVIGLQTASLFGKSTIK